MANAFERFNRVIGYIEESLTSDIDYEKAAEIACCPRSQFQRLFAYMADIPLTEYVRRRRLTLSAFELQQNGAAVLDVAVKYGYDSHAAFARAFRRYHGFSPTQARDKGRVFTVYPRLTFKNKDFESERSGSKVAVLGKIEFLDLPAVRMVGKMVLNGGGENPVPEGFDYRDLPPCLVGNGYINGTFADGDVFRHSHELTVEGIAKCGYEPDYTFGWSAEAYAGDRRSRRRRARLITFAHAGRLILHYKQSFPLSIVLCALYWQQMTDIHEDL